MKLVENAFGRSHRRLALGAAAVSVATAGVLAGGAASAQAASGFTIHISPNNTLGLLLDVNGGSTSPGTGVIDWYANGGANQVWTFIPFGNNVYEIQNENSGQCLTTDGVAGDQVYQLQCAGGTDQLWQTGLNPSTASAWTIDDPYTGLYLDVNSDSPWAGTSIDTWYYNGGANQYFAAL